MKSTLFTAWMALFMSLIIAACAAYFSITGLSVIFAAALIPVVVMATTLEIGKLGATFFLHHFWNELPRKLKYPMSVMVMILMIITSMGIFGFLSKGHIEQEAPTVELSLDIKDADARIEQHQSRITTLQQQTDQLNGALQKLLDFSKVSGKTGYLARKAELNPQLQLIEQGIVDERAKIQEIRDKQTKFKRSMAGIEAKLGPVKYVAQLFGYDLERDPEGKGKAVRIVIIMFMIAFDPFAIFLIMAGDWAFNKYRKERKFVVLEEENLEIKDLKHEKDELQAAVSHHLLNEEQLDQEIDKISLEIASVYEKLLIVKDKEIENLNEMVQNAEHVEHVVFRDVEVPVEIRTSGNDEYVQELEQALVILQTELEDKKMELQEFLDTLAEIDQSLEAKPTEVEKIVEVVNDDLVNELEESNEALAKEFAEVKASHQSQLEEAESNIAELHELNALKEVDLTTAKTTIEEHLGEITKLETLITDLKSNINELESANDKLTSDIGARDKAVENLNTKYQLIERVPGLGIMADNVASTVPSTGFGTSFPTDPLKDQLFLRVDSVPSVLHKFEGSRWVEITKDNDVEYDEKYLQHLITELGDGKIELNELSDKEQSEIQSLLSKEDVLGK